MDQCLEHQSVKSACQQIPALMEKVSALINALNGEVGKQGWISSMELRVSSVERSTSTLLKITWAIGSIFGTAIIGALCFLVFKSQFGI